MNTRSPQSASVRTRVTPLLATLACAAVMLIAPASAFAQAAAPLASQDTRPAATQDVDLRPKFKKGQETRFDMALDIQSEQKISGAEAKNAIQQRIGLLLRVKEVTEGGAATIDLVYESLKLDADSALGKISFDSAKPKDEKDQFDTILRSIVGLTLTLQMDDAGRITSVTTSSSPAGVPADMLQQFTGADLIRGLFGPVLTIKSGDGTARVGETWTNESTMTAPMGTTRIKTNYTLDSYRDSNAQMSIQGSVSLDGSSSGMANIREGSITGRATWNTQRGMLESMTMRQQLIVDTKLAGQDAGSTKNTMNVTVTRK